MYDAGNPKLVLWQLRGIRWEGKWEGGSGEKVHMYSYGQFMFMYGKKHHNIVITLQLN